MIFQLQVNFNEMMMFKPNKRMIRRSFQDGVWIQYKTSPHQVQFHAKINRIQVCLFVVYLSPSAVPCQDHFAHLNKTKPLTFYK